MRFGILNSPRRTGGGDTGLPGGHSEREPPDSIPNSEVKPLCADGSVGPPHARVGHRQAPAVEPRWSIDHRGFFLCAVQIRGRVAGEAGIRHVEFINRPIDSIRSRPSRNTLPSSAGSLDSGLASNRPTPTPYLRRLHGIHAIARARGGRSCGFPDRVVCHRGDRRRWDPHCRRQAQRRCCRRSVPACG